MKLYLLVFLLFPVAFTARAQDTDPSGPPAAATPQRAGIVPTLPPDYAAVGVGFSNLNVRGAAPTPPARGPLGKAGPNFPLPDFTASVDGTYALCNVSAVDVPITLDGATSYRVTVTIEDTTGNVVTTTLDATGSFDLSIDYPATVRLTEVVDGSGATGTVSGEAIVIGDVIDLTVASTPPDCPAAANGTATVEVPGDAADYTFSWSDGGTDSVRTDLQATLYTLDVALTSAPGCQTRRTLDLRLAPLQLDSITFAPPNCAGDAVTLTPRVSGGSGDYRFFWREAGSSDSLLVVTAAAGSQTYTLEVTDGCPGVVESGAATVETPLPLRVGLRAPSVSCPGDEVRLVAIAADGRAPFAFSWNEGEGRDSVFVTNTVRGANVITVAVTDGCGGMARDSVEYNLSAGSASLSGNYSVCNVESVEVPLQLRGDSFFRVRLRENGNERVITATGDTLLTYRSGTVIELLDVTGTDGCTASIGAARAEVFDLEWNVNATVTNVACAGEAAGAINLAVSGGSGDYTYSWDSPGLSGPNPRNLVAGTYRLTITDLSPVVCRFDTVFNVLEPSSNITLVRDSLRGETCNQLAYAEAFYSGGTAPLTYAWSNGNTGPQLGLVRAGTYDLSVTDAGGCLITQRFPLQDERIDVVAEASVSVEEIDCRQTTSELSAAPNDRPVDYRWRDQRGNTISENQTLTVTAAGRYDVLITDPVSGCRARDTVEVRANNQPPEPELPVSYALTCSISEVDITVTLPEEDTTDLTFAWTRNGTPIAGTGTTISNISDTGRYVVQIVRPATGCTATAATEVVENRRPPTIRVDNPTVALDCFGPVAELRVFAPGNYSFVWTTVNGRFVGPANSPTVTVNRQARYVLNVVDNANGCSTRQSFDVTTEADVIPALAGEDAVLLCRGRGTPLTGEYGAIISGARARWISPRGEVLSTSTTAFTLEAGPHVFEVIHPVSGCSTTDTVDIISEAPTDISYSQLQPPCPEVGGRLFVDSVAGLHPPFRFVSSGGVADPGGRSFSELRDGNYRLTVTDNRGCTYSEGYRVFGTGRFTGSSDPVELELGDSAELGVETNRSEEEITQWQWENLPDSTACTDCPNPIVRPRESFTATVTATDTSGCRLRLRQEVVVSEENLVYVPTAFSPANQDGMNDRYTVFGDGDFVANVDYLRIHNRWGVLVFEAENIPVNAPEAGWDGRFGAEFAPGGTYVYSALVTLDNGRQQSLRGTLTLIR